MDTIIEKPYAGALQALWQIFRHELLYVTWALMDIALIAPLFLALNPWTTFWPPALVALWLLLIMLIPFNLSRLASVVGLSVQRQQILMVAAMTITVLLAWRNLLYDTSNLFDFGWFATFVSHIADSTDPRWPRAVALFAFIALLWWRGISLAGRGVDYRDVGLRMRGGILLALFLVAGLAGSQLDWPVTPFILLFFFASLVSIVLTRVEQLELSRSGQSFPIGPSWLFIVFVVAAAVALSSGVIAGLVSGQSIGVVLGWFEPIWIAVRFALATVVSILGLLLSPLLVALIVIVEWIFSFFGSTVGAGLENLQLTIPPVASVTPEELPETSPLVGQDYRQILTVLVMIFVILLVALALGRLFRLARPAAELQHESVSPFEGLTRPEKPGLGRRLLNQLNILRRWRVTASIRQAYREMCARAAENGYSRGRSETPYEYTTTLAELWPEHRREVTLITEAYNRAHYGEVPENEEELQRILDAWERLSMVEVDPLA